MDRITTSAGRMKSQYLPVPPRRELRSIAGDRPLAWQDGAARRWLGSATSAVLHDFWRYSNRAYNFARCRKELSQAMIIAICWLLDEVASLLDRRVGAGPSPHRRRRDSLECLSYRRIQLNRQSLPAVSGLASASLLDTPARLS